ncbi:MAG: NapC/NirT family cytochrome c, partial [Chloroflexota bacterium]|nr:NapC/NirT family cytochrome c [Chloroflexota bacterium]
MNRGCGFALAALGIVVFLVLIIGGAGFQWVNSQPWFCNTCHEMNFHYASWESSTHGTKAACLDCHAEPGVRGFIEEKARGAEQLVAHFTGNDQVPIKIIVRVKN